MFTDPKQPSIETRFHIGLLGYLTPLGMMMFAHIFNVVISDNLRRLLMFISTAFMGMICMETAVMLWNIFFVQKLIPYHSAMPNGDPPMKTAESFNPNKRYVSHVTETNSKGYVYLLAALHDSSLYKIGRTNNPANRLKTFNVKLPFPVDYICTIKTEDMYKLERDLHHQYASKRLDGEWFRLSTEDVQYTMNLRWATIAPDLR